jgi:hypothetical protein
MSDDRRDEPRDDGDQRQEYDPPVVEDLATEDGPVSVAAGVNKSPVEDVV